MSTRVLFVCSQNRLRSPTAEQIFSVFPELECASAGTDEQADTPLEPELVQWADVIFVMEKAHRMRLTKRFGQHLNGKRVVVLDIPDNYAFMDPALVSLLQRKVAPLLKVRFDA